MNNPFLSNGFVLPTASLNIVKIMGLGDLPINPWIVNKTAKELLCGETVSFLINHFINKTGIHSQNPFETLEIMSESSHKNIRQQAESVLRKLGGNLGYILLVLKRGDFENRAARSNWNDAHWEYWKGLTEIEVAGGLMQGKFGKKILEYTAELFTQLNAAPYETKIARDADILPLIGAARFAARYCDSVAFDFGHSYIKSCIIKRGAPSTLFIKDKIPAKHVIGDNDNEEYSISDALALDKFIRDVIISTLESAKQYINTEQTTNIAVSIANYVSGGNIAPRGSYRKLSLIADNYESYLSAKISQATNSSIAITLIHDSTSAAIAAKETGSNKAVITLGTSLGVGFTDCFDKLPPFEYVLQHIDSVARPTRGLWV